MLMPPMIKRLIIWETIFETGSLTDEPLYNQLKQKLDKLGRKLNNFIQSVEKEHMSVK